LPSNTVTYPAISNGYRNISGINYKICLIDNSAAAAAAGMPISSRPTTANN
jgi:hypothetical protein